MAGGNSGDILVRVIGISFAHNDVGTSVETVSLTTPRRMSDVSNIGFVQLHSSRAHVSRVLSRSRFLVRLSCPGMRDAMCWLSCVARTRAVVVALVLFSSAISVILCTAF